MYSGACPLLSQEGWLWHQEEDATASLLPQTGWFLSGLLSKCIFATFRLKNHPGCFAATPPDAGGDTRPDTL